MRKRVIDKNEAEGVDRFAFPTVDPTALDALRGAALGSAHLLTAGQVAALERQVKEEARQQGYDEGLAAGKAEIGARIGRLEALITSFAQPFQALEEAVENELVALAIRLASHLVRREIEHDPGVLHAAVADCMAALATSVRDVTIYFNPEDAKLVREHLEGTADQRFKIATDAELARGDLRVASASSLVDGSLAERCAAIVAAARSASE
jgi:flagellar assembly protein FliH